LLHDPIAGRMNSSVEVQNPPTAMFDGEEVIKSAKGKRRNREEIDCRNHFAVV
jgi:hypothetical protein